MLVPSPLLSTNANCITLPQQLLHVIFRFYPHTLPFLFQVMSTGCHGSGTTVAWNGSEPLCEKSWYGTNSETLVGTNYKTLVGTNYKTLIGTNYKTFAGARY